MESKHLLMIVAVVSVAAVILSGAALGVALTKNNGNGLTDMKYTVYVGTDCTEYKDAEKMMTDILKVSDEKFKNGYTAFVATGGTSESQGIVKNKYSIVLIYGMVTDEKALFSFIDTLKGLYPTSVILTEKSDAKYNLYIPVGRIVKS